MLTHLPPGADHAKACALASASFGGAVEVAAQGRVLELPSRPARP